MDNDAHTVTTGHVPSKRRAVAAAGEFFGWGVNYDRIVLTPEATRARHVRYPVHVHWSGVVRSLGKRTARIYSLLVGVRDHRTLLAHPTRARLAAEVGCSVSAVAKSLARLAAARLVRFEGRVSVACASGAVDKRGKPRMVAANCWRVFGQPWRYRRAGRQPEGLAVGTRTAKWMAAQRGWGGARAGAGRPRKDGKPLQSLGAKSRGVAYTSLKVFKPSSQREDDSKTAKSVNFSFSQTVSITYTKHRAQYADARRLARAQARAKAAQGVMMDTPQMGTRTPHGLVLSTGAAPAPAGWWGALVARGVVPPEPTDTAMPPVIVRPPPLIPTTAPPAAQVRQLLAAYWGWLAFIGAKGRPYARNVKPADRQMLAEVAAYMAEHEMAPSLWFSWRTASWNEKKPRGARMDAPPTWYTFKLATLAKLRGFCKHSTMAPDHVVSRIVPAARELLVRYCRLRLDTMGGGCTEQAAREAMAKHLTWDAYHSLLSAAKGQAFEAQTTVDAERDAGQWIWG